MTAIAEFIRGHSPKCPSHLAEDAVHVWAASLDVNRDAVTNLASILSDAERERAVAFKFEHLRNRFVVCRGLLRVLLGGYLKCAPGQIEFVYSERGKPGLSPASDARSLEFNVSHSDGMALLAFTRLGAVGVDIERLRAMKDPEGLVTRFFSAREREQFQTVASEERQSAFFNLWTRKEAWLKATGLGIAGELNKVEVTFLPQEPVQFFGVPAGHGTAQEWSLFDLRPAAEYVGALAIQSRDVQLQCWMAD